MGSRPKGIKCIAPILDSSGYAEWSRAYITNLIDLGIPVTITVPSFEGSRPDTGHIGEKLKPHINLNIEYDLVICWLIPPIAAQFFRKEPDGVKKVIFTLWETDLLYKPWSVFINSYADECWLPGDFNKQIYLNSGIKIPIKTFNFAMDEKNYNSNVQIQLQQSPGVLIPDSTYIFYYISQWTERKNFKELIEAFWSEFSPEEDVCLVLKTHINNYSEEESRYLQGILNSIAKSGNYTNTANVVLLNKLLPREYVLGLHNRCDCYVSPSRGEGLGLGILEAGMVGNPVIVNTFGEHWSYLKDLNLEQFGLEYPYVYGHSMRPVSGMPGEFYNGKQSWAQPDIKGMAKQMRHCFDNREESYSVGEALKTHLINKGSVELVKRQLLDSISSFEFK